MEEKGLKIILFDEACNLCNSSLNFVKNRDREERFSFIALQSPIGKDMLTIFGLSSSEIDSVVFIDDCKPYLRSGAGLRILKELGWPWKIFYSLIVIPKPIRDFVYSLIAKNRYKFPGAKHTCPVPSS